MCVPAVCSETLSCLQYIVFKCHWMCIGKLIDPGSSLLSFSAKRWDIRIHIFSVSPWLYTPLLTCSKPKVCSQFWGRSLVCVSYRLSSYRQSQTKLYWTRCDCPSLDHWGFIWKRPGDDHSHTQALLALLLWSSYRSPEENLSKKKNLEIIFMVVWTLKNRFF